MPAAPKLSDAAVLGLGPSGRTLALRLAQRGVRVAVWDCSVAAMVEFITANIGIAGGLVGYASLEDLLLGVTLTRRIARFACADASLCEQPWPDSAGDLVINCYDLAPEGDAARWHDAEALLAPGLS